MRAGQAQYGEHVRVVELRRNFGQTAAMQAGIDLARGDVIATLDGDLQNDPIDIPRMVNRLLDEDLDLVSGWRKNRQDAVIMRKIPSRIANKLIRKITGVALHDYGCSLKVFRAEVVKACIQSGVSIAEVAMANGLNANLVRLPWSRTTYARGFGIMAFSPTHTKLHDGHDHTSALSRRQRQRRLSAWPRFELQARSRCRLDGGARWRG